MSNPNSDLVPLVPSKPGTPDPFHAIRELGRKAAAKDLAAITAALGRGTDGFSLLDVTTFGWSSIEDVRCREDEDGVAPHAERFPTQYLGAAGLPFVAAVARQFGVESFPAGSVAVISDEGGPLAGIAIVGPTPCRVVLTDGTTIVSPNDQRATACGYFSIAFRVDSRTLQRINTVADEIAGRKAGA